MKPNRQSLPAMILAGGLGKRLRTAYCNGPKSLAPVAGRPFLDYLLSWLDAAGFRKVVLCVGYKRGQIERRYRRIHYARLRLSFSVEKRPLGTAGAVRNAARLIRQGTFLVANGDSLFNVDPIALVGFHLRHRALATLALAPAPRGSRYGAVRVARSGEIREFTEKGDTRSSRYWINAGIYVLDREVVSRIPAGREVSLEHELFPQLIGQRFFGYPTRGYFIDIGVPEDYRKAQEDFRGRFLQ